jgi:hypothetical protein
MLPPPKQKKLNGGEFPTAIVDSAPLTPLVTHVHGAQT